MKHLFKSFKTILVSAGLFVGLVILCNCNNSKYIQQVNKVSNIVDWEITFNDHVTEAQKANVLIAIDKYILNSLDSSGITIVSITIKQHIPILGPGVPLPTRVTVSRLQYGGTEASPTIPVPRRGPKFPPPLEDMGKYIKAIELNKYNNTNQKGGL